MKNLIALAFLGAAGLCLGAGRQFAAYRSFVPAPKTTARFAAEGFDVRAFGVCNTAWGSGRFYTDRYPMVWEGPGRYNWASLDAQVGDLLKASPKAKFIALIDLNTPLWMVRRTGLDSFSHLTHLAGNADYRKAAGEWLVAVLKRLEEKYAGRMLAYVLMAGQTTEWFEYDRGIMSNAKTAAWRDWCKRNGRAEIDPPTPRALDQAAFNGVLYDPVRERDKIDWWRFHNDVVADALLHFAKTAKGVLPKDREVGAFYGYYNVANGDWFARGGHLAYERVAASPDVDFFLSPATYCERECGAGTGTMAVAGTLRRHGKRVFHEIDCWPHDNVAEYFGNCPWKNAADDLAGYTREGAFALVNGCSWWWFDLWGNHYHDETVIARLAALQKIRNRFASERPKLLADALLVADPETALQVAGGPLRDCGDRFRNKLNRIGVMYDTCSFDDLKAMDLTPFKLICLPATWVITPARAKFLEEKILTGGRTVLWTYAAGVSDGKTLDAGRVKRWAGVPFGAPLTTTARDGWTSVYVAYARDLTREQLRAICEKAGCHVYTEELLPVAANERLLAVHSATGGAKRIALPFKAAKVVDLLTGETAVENASSFTATFAEPDTKLWEIVR